MATPIPSRSRRKTDLVEFQNRLHERLSSGSAGPALRARLAFELGPESWLLPMSAVSEVLPVPHLEPVPLTQSWFAGVTNVRGNLFGVVDLQGFLGAGQTAIDGNSRILLVNRSRLAGAALLVSRTVGLRHAEQLQRVNEGDLPKFARHAYQDKDGRRWTELDIKRLLADAAFLRISHFD